MVLVVSVVSVGSGVVGGRGGLLSGGGTPGWTGWCVLDGGRGGLLSGGGTPGWTGRCVLARGRGGLLSGGGTSSWTGCALGKVSVHSVGNSNY